MSTVSAHLFMHVGQFSTVSTCQCNSMLHMIILYTFKHRKDPWTASMKEGTDIDQLLQLWSAVTHETSNATSIHTVWLQKVRQTGLPAVKKAFFVGDFTVLKTFWFKKSIKYQVLVLNIQSAISHHSLQENRYDFPSSRTPNALFDQERSTLLITATFSAWHACPLCSASLIFPLWQWLYSAKR